MIPFFALPSFELFGHTLRVFPLLALAAVAVQLEMTLRRATRFGIARAVAGSLIVWATAAGLVSAHFFDVLAYRPQVLRSDPLELFRVWGELASTGGMLGGLAALYWIARRRGMPGVEVLRFFDVALFALPFTLAVGRLGCALQHDHLGVASESFLAVRFPDGPRFDLGLLELFLCGAIAASFLALDRRARPAGFFTGLFFALYGPARFALDFLRIGEARYAGLTPAQLLMIGASGAGIALLVSSARAGPGEDSERAARH